MAGENIFRGAMVLAVASFTTKILGMLYKIPITNIIGDQGNAIYASAYNIYVLLITFSAIGMPSAISKLVSERRAVGAHKEAHKVYRVALGYAVVLSIILASILWFGAESIALTMQNENLVMPLRALAPTAVIVTIMAVTRGYLQGTGNMVPTAISQVTEQAFNALFSVILAYVFVSNGIVAAATGSTIGTGVGAISGLIILMVIYFRKKSGLKIQKSSDSIYKDEKITTILYAILWTVVPIVLSTSVFAIITNIDTLMLNVYLPEAIETLVETDKFHMIHVTGAEDMTTPQIVDSLTGQYLGKYLTLINVPVALILTIAMAATPAISADMAQRNYANVRNKIRMILKVGALFAVPATVGLTIFAEPIMKLLYSNASDGYRLLMYGSVSILFIALAQLTTGVLQGMGKQFIPTQNAFIACILKVAINFLFLKVPELNVYSVVHSTTICYILYSILNVTYIYKHVELTLNWKSIAILPAISAILMGVVARLMYTLLVLLTKSSAISLFISICCAVIVYFIIGVYIGAITKKDLDNIPGGNKLVKVVRFIK
ncbi:MAG: hypothetical protein ATN35_06830 [Epulopiscium sp. Nele67-Bin004]|nr:MAG: hypothetical protein ATN35_06830 [Epulopiscium sp. Nele67-Bin004]